jgi:4-amino-4-deoxy-L-arabinose transferase-like glycosyltransferase
MTLTAIICIAIPANLHSPWAPVPWLIEIVIWACYFWPDQVETYPSLPEPLPFPYVKLVFVLATACALRLYKLNDFPLGPYVDEILTLNNSLALLDQTFDLFGQRPLLWQDWVQTANLYLYFNVLILKLFGVSYWSMKLFSAIPGIIACGAVFLISHLLFSRRVALWIALLFTCAHWTVRLSRYGWDVSFMVMAFSIAIWLLLLGMQRGRPLYTYFAGMTAGLSLYSYQGARIGVLSLLSFLALEWVLARDRRIFKHATAFAAGTGAVAYPLLCYYVFKPRAFWVRVAELSVFNNEHPLTVIFDNVWRHALMFHAMGGTYARDNYPGLPMMDPLTGLLSIVGLVVLVRSRNLSYARLIGCVFLLNFTSGVFSVSPEGAPYVYRAAAVMIPAFLITGLGVDPVIHMLERWLNVKILLGSTLALMMVSNLYLYFGLERKNSAAMRVMAYELRLIGLEIAQDNLPVILVGQDIFDQTETDSKPGEKYAHANRPPLMPEPLRSLAVINFSGRYDPTQSLAHNFTHPRNLYLVDTDSLKAYSPPVQGPAKLILRSRDRRVWDSIRGQYPNASVRDVRNIHGEPVLLVAILPKLYGSRPG